MRQDSTQGYRPLSVSECIKKIRDLSSLLLDLTYYALLYADRDFTHMLQHLAEQIDQYWRQLILHTVFAFSGLSMEDAKFLASFMDVAHLMKRAVDSMQDFAKLLSMGYRPHSILLRALEMSEEQVAMAEVVRSMSVRDLIDNAGASLDIIAVKCGTKWHLDPPADRLLHRGDLIVFRTTRDVVDALARSGLVKIKKPQIPEEAADADSVDLVQDLVTMKNISEIALDLAYLAILSRDTVTIEEVVEIEQYFDEKHLEFEKKILTKLRGDPVEILTLIRYSLCLEEIVDTAYGIALLVRDYPEVGAFLEKAVRESDEVILKFTVRSQTIKTLEELGLDDIGLTVLAIRRGKELIVLPNKSTRLQDGDVIIIKCYRDALEEIKEKLSTIVEA